MRLEEERKRIEKELSAAGVSGADKVTVRGYEHFNDMIDALNKINAEIEDRFVVYYTDDESDDGTI